MDKSSIEKKYFINNIKYNCPFCNVRNVQYEFDYYNNFNWDEKKICHIYLVSCSLCKKRSLHLSYKDIRQYKPQLHGQAYPINDFDSNTDIDSLIFHSVPTSFFILDEKIPKDIRELISEGEGCLKMNFLTGASACIRKAIYELTIHQKCSGKNYEKKIKSLKLKYPTIDAAYFDILDHIKDMTSEKVHEQSWDKWESKYLTLIIETLKSILHEIYVIPIQKKENSTNIQKLREEVFKEKKNKKEEQNVN